MSKPKFPMIVRKGSFEVKIYHCQSKRGYDNYYVSYYLNRVRKRVVFVDLAKAKKEAKYVVRQLDKMEHEVLELTSTDRIAYQYARRYLDPIGVSVERAAMDYADAVKKLGKVPLWQAVDYFLEWGPGQMKTPVADVVAEFIELKDEAWLSEVYVKRLKYSLEKFATRFKGNILNIKGAEIDSWLRGLRLGPRSRNNLRQDIAALFRYAVRRRYLPRDHDELTAVPVLRQLPGDIEVFTPAEMVETLCHTPERAIPFFVLGAFAGVRHAEILRLEWKDVDVEGGYVTITAAKAKTASRRIVPIAPNLREWLSQSRPTEGRVCELVNMANEIHDIVVRINKARQATWEKGRRSPECTPHSGEGNTGEEYQPFVWRQNGLRHSFVSYRVAQIQNVDQVALEAGTSREMVFKNYRALVTSAAAREWFSITPAVVEQAKQQLCPASAAHDESRASQVIGQAVEDGGQGGDR